MPPPATLDTAPLQRLKLRHLLCLAEILEHRSLQKAALRLHVTESAASKTLKELETVLGARLFERSRRGMLPTAEGRAFGSHAQHALQALHLGAAAVAGGEAARQTTLRVAAMPIAAAGFLPEVVREFTRRHPATRVEITVGAKSGVLAELRQGAVDLAVGRLPPAGDMDGLGFEQLLLDLYVLAVRRGHPLARRKRLALRELAGCGFVMPSRQTVIWQEIQRFFVAQGFQPDGPVVEILDLHFCKQYVQRTDAVWIASLGFLRADALLGELAVLPIDTAMLAAPIGLITRTEAGLAPAVREFAALVRDIGRAHGASLEQMLK